MEAAFQELCLSLEGLQELYQQMLVLAGKKQKQLVLGNLKELESLTKEEENLVYEAGRLENERYQQAKRLIDRYQLSQDATLTDFIAVAPQEDKGRLQELQENMNKLVLEIDRLNQENIILIEQSLKFINFSVDILTKPEDIDTYESDLGKNSKQDNISRILDKKI